MLELKKAEEVRSNFEKNVTDKILEAQNEFGSECYFNVILPKFIVVQLQDLGYTVDFCYDLKETYVGWGKQN